MFWLRSQASLWAGRAGWPLGVPVEEGCGSQSGSCWPPGDLGRSSVGLLFAIRACSPTSAAVWAGDVTSRGGWLGRRCHPCPGGPRSSRSHPAQGCRASPAQGFPPALDHKDRPVFENWPKPKPRSRCWSSKRGGNKQQISHLLDQPYSHLHERTFFDRFSFTWLCTNVSVTKAFTTQKVVTAMKFPLCNLPQYRSSQGVFVPS